MNCATNLLHSLRSQQLRALVGIRSLLPWTDQEWLIHWMKLTNGSFDTQSLSDKELEMIDTLSLRHLDRVK